MASHWLPCPVVFITTAHGEKRDIMTATAMFISEKEPLMVVSVAKGHLTAQLIEQSGEFVAAVAAEGQQELTWQLGSVRGEAEDKFTRFSIPTLPSAPGKPLVPRGVSSWLACKMVSCQEVEGSLVVIAKVESQEDMGNPPLVWHKQALFSLKAL
jgi:flavin reductase (DIM6/NTAB) family NADH-FMN oxidoreductase RutF